MKKRAWRAVLALMMGAALAACGSTGGNNASQSGGSPSEQAARESKAGEDTMKDAKEFRIGGSGPLTGGAASYGNSVKNGAAIAIDEINAAGGVKAGKDTYKLVLDFQDDEASEDKAVTAYNNLMDAKMNVFMGAVTSGSTLAVTDLTNKDNILQLTPSGSAASITQNPNVFRLCFTDPMQGQKIAEYVLDQGFESVAVLYNNSDEYSTGIYQAFKLGLEDLGRPDLLVSEQSFQNDDVDFTTQLTQIKQSGAKLLFVPAYYEAAAYIVQQAKQNGLDTAFVGSDGWDGVLAQVTDKSTVEGAVFLSPFLATDESAKSFTDAYQKQFGAVPDQFAADGYDCVYVIKAAMEKAGSIDTDALIQAMTKIEVEGLTGKVSFTPEGEPNKQAKFVTITDGKYELFELDEE